jgi:cytochrome c-type biogenesis protein CcmH/NrfG
MPSAEVATAGAGVAAAAAASHLSRPFDAPGSSVQSTGRSRIAGELRVADPDVSPAPVVREPGPTGRAGGWLATILLLLIVGAGAFYGGLKFQQSRNEQAATLATTQTPTPLPTVADPTYESLRQQVDAAPLAESSRMANEANGKSPDDARFFSLYGRSLLLSGKNQEALSALKLADQKLGSSANAHDALSVDTRLALAAAAVRANDANVVHDAAQSLSTVIESGASNNSAAASPGTTASASPSATPFQ